MFKWRLLGKNYRAAFGDDYYKFQVKYVTVYALDSQLLGKAAGYNRGKGGSMHITDISRGMLGADGIVGGGIPIAVRAPPGLLAVPYACRLSM